MKIGILVEDIKVGGAEKVAINQVRALRKSGVDAHLLVLRGAGIKKNVFESDKYNLPIKVLDSRLPLFLRFNFKFPGFAFFSFFHVSYAFLLPFVVKKNEFDYIISHGSYTTFSALTISFLKNIPFSIFFWDPIFYILNRVYSKKFPKPFLYLLSFIGKKLDYILVKYSDMVLVGGKIHDDYFKKIHNKVNIQLVLPGTNLGTPVKTKKDYVFALTAWKAGKDPNFMLELAKKLPNVNFKVGGKWLDDSLLANFKKKLQEYNLQNNVEILGYIPESSMQKLFSEATVLLTTNLEKGFGMPILEAAANGTTFIVPNGSGVCDLFTNTKDGFFVTEKDKDDIVEKIRYLIDNKDSAIKMGFSAYNKVKSKYTWEAHAQKLLSLIKHD